MSKTFSTSNLIPFEYTNGFIKFKTSSKNGMANKLVHYLLVGVVIVTFMANILFIMTTTLQMKENSQNRVDVPGNVPPQFIIQPQPVENYGERRKNDQDIILSIELFSSKDNITVTVNDQKVVDISHPSFRGINVAVLNQATGALMASRGFDTYAAKQDSGLLVDLIEDITEGRILCFTVKDEASLSLKKFAIHMIKSLGSSYIGGLRWRDSWAFVTQKTGRGGRPLAEGYQKTPKMKDAWASPVLLHTSFVAETLDNTRCTWDDSAASRRRQEFCDKYEGYRGVCRCDNPTKIDLNPPTLEDGSRVKLPVAVMASTRPHYLFRMLSTLHGVVGLDPDMVTVYIDGFYDEPASVAKLFNLRVDQHEPISKLNSRIAQHYKKSLTTSFDRYPDSEYLVILEEDLDISVDILTYFQQLLPILETDESLFCISAWNDQGYEHSVSDPSMLYRLETMPGLGWVLSRKIYKGELEAKWPKPNEFYDWDMWTRGIEQLKNRECIIPDVSRTYHFGAKGLNMNPYFQDAYFTKHAFNRKANVKFNAEIMRKENYEKEVHRLVSTGTLLDHSSTPCVSPKTYVPDTKGKTYVFYIKMDHAHDWKTWENVARCFRLWDLDVRGFHKNMFRFWIKGNHILVVGCPVSPYCVNKPKDIIPISMLKTERRPADN